MSEEDLKIVRELFDRARENFERDGYLAPVLLAWALDRAPTISLIEGNLRNILPGMCHTLRLSGYDRFTLIMEGWIVMGEENLKNIQRWVGRMGEHPKAQTSVQIIFVSLEETCSKFAVYDETEAGWLLVKEAEATPDWTLAGVLIEALKGSADGKDKEE
ncbi:MAG TPA: hypothetical protein DCP08_07545 [Chloroflexi bacterium]|nr:hypothetical protein [Chloroflexota bacterium]